MSLQCDIARLAIKKHALLAELDACRNEIKALCLRKGVELPFAVEVDDVAVTVAKPQWEGAPPQTKVLPLHKGCEAKRNEMNSQ